MAPEANEAAGAKDADEAGAAASASAVAGAPADDNGVLSAEHAELLRRLLSEAKDDPARQGRLARAMKLYYEPYEMALTSRLLRAASAPCPRLRR